MNELLFPILLLQSILAAESPPEDIGVSAHVSVCVIVCVSLCVSLDVFV